MLRLITSPRFADHLVPPGHPESVARHDVMQAVAAGWVEAGVVLAEPRAASPEELGRVHAAQYIEAIDRTGGRTAMLDPDTFASPESASVAALAAGAAIVGVEHALADPGAAALVLVRPPGHHAEATKAMGFCLYNNIAVAAAAALAAGVDRVAIVDFDVHHGNGTQRMFYDDPRVLYVSTHQYPYYPGTGAAGEAGVSAGEGFTVNVPLEAGATSEDYQLVFDAVVLPVLTAFSPDLLLVSAGFDLHERDPLAGMRVTTRGCASLVERLLTSGSSGRRAVLVTEGGYHLKALAACLHETIALMTAGQDLPGKGPPRPGLEGDEVDAGGGLTGRGARGVDLARAVHGRHWRGL